MGILNLDRLIGGPEHRSQVMGALNALAQDGVVETSGHKINQTIIKLKPPAKPRWPWERWLHDRVPEIGLGFGTLYNALSVLEKEGKITSRWEENPPSGGPRRRLYQLTNIPSE